MSRIVVRRRRFNDYDDVTHLFHYESETRVMVDTHGHPVVWHVEPDIGNSFFVTYLEVLNEG